MNEERLIKLGLLSEKEKRLRQLEIRGERAVTDIRVYLFSEDGLEGVEIEKAEQAMKDLRGVIEEYRRVKEDIRKLREDLGQE